MKSLELRKECRTGKANSLRERMEDLLAHLRIEDLVSEVESKKV
jgi:hypothetical protein